MPPDEQPQGPPDEQPPGLRGAVRREAAARQFEEQLEERFGDDIEGDIKRGEDFRIQEREGSIRGVPTEEFREELAAAQAGGQRTVRDREGAATEREAALRQFEEQTTTDLDAEDIEQTEEGDFQLTPMAAAEEFEAQLRQQGVEEQVFPVDLRKTESGGYVLKESAERRLASLQTGFAPDQLERTPSGSFEVKDTAVAERIERRTGVDVTVEDIERGDAGGLGLTSEAERRIAAANVDERTDFDVSEGDLTRTESGDFQLREDVAREQARMELLERFSERTDLDRFQVTEEDIRVVETEAGFQAEFEEGVLDRELRESVAADFEQFSPADVKVTRQDGELQAGISEEAIEREQEVARQEQREEAVTTFLERNPEFERTDLRVETQDGELRVGPEREAVVREQRERFAQQYSVSSEDIRIKDGKLVLGPDPITGSPEAFEEPVLDPDNIRSESGFTLTETSRQVSIDDAEMARLIGATFGPGSLGFDVDTDRGTAVSMRDPVPNVGDADLSLESLAGTVRKSFVEPVGELTGDVFATGGGILGSALAQGGPVTKAIGRRFGPAGEVSAELLTDADPELVKEAATGTAETFGTNVGRGGAGLLNVPQTIIDVDRAVSFVGEGVAATATGEGGELIQVTESGEVEFLEGGFAEEKLEPVLSQAFTTATENPIAVTGSAVGSVALSGGLIGGVQKVGGRGLSRAVSATIQPGEELAITAARRGVVSPGLATKVPGVRRGMIEGGGVDRGQLDLTFGAGKTEPELEIEVDADDLRAGLGPEPPMTPSEQLLRQEIARTPEFEVDRPSVRYRSELERDIAASYRQLDEALEGGELDIPTTDFRVETGLEPIRSGVRTEDLFRIEPRTFTEYAVEPSIETDVAAVSDVRSTARVESDNLIEQSLRPELQAEETSVETKTVTKPQVRSEVEGVRTGFETGVESRTEVGLRSRTEVNMLTEQLLRLEPEIEQETDRRFESEARTEPRKEIRLELESRSEIKSELDVEPKSFEREKPDKLLFGDTFERETVIKPGDPDALIQELNAERDSLEVTEGNQ